MGTIYAALATLIINVASVLPTSVFRLTVYYRPPLFAASHELAAYYSALTVVSLQFEVFLALSLRSIHAHWCKLANLWLLEKSFLDLM